jgi:hypothetical protein
MSKKSILALVSVLALALVVSACGGGVKAPTMADGKPLTLVVLMDRGLEGKTPDEQNQLNQLGDFHQNDLVNALKDAGYNASLIGSAAEFTPAAGVYMLKVAVVKYNPGSKAARMMVGFGAGTTSLDVRYELFSTDPAAPFYAKDHGRASSVDWPKLVHVVDSDLVNDVTTQLAAQPK